MFKLSWRKIREALGCNEPDWRHDPSGHPALMAMSARELADLPMVPEVPMRAKKVEVAALDCRQDVGGERPAGCVA
ncbi:MAG: hypothetical protein QE484_12720 [Rhizobium sp.]|nr:hypothetical protein [Rhizobium sp.]